MDKAVYYHSALAIHQCVVAPPLQHLDSGGIGTAVMQSIPSAIAWHDRGTRPWCWLHGPTGTPVTEDLVFNDTLHTHEVSVLPALAYTALLWEGQKDTIESVDRLTERIAHTTFAEAC